jgi:hypothetical protein
LRSSQFRKESGCSKHRRGQSARPRGEHSASGGHGSWCDAINKEGGGGFHKGHHSASSELVCSIRVCGVRAREHARESVPCRHGAHACSSSPRRAGTCDPFGTLEKLKNFARTFRSYAPRPGLLPAVTPASGSRCARRCPRRTSSGRYRGGREPASAHRAIHPSVYSSCFSHAFDLLGHACMCANACARANLDACARKRECACLH